MRYIVSMGSNSSRREKLALARKRLAVLFPDIRFSAEEDTEPLFFRHSGLFANQVACFTSSLPATEVVSCLKEVEREAGRQPGDKEREVVLLDLDLLAGDGIIYRPKDLEREYVRRGIRSLGINL